MRSNAEETTDARVIADSLDTPEAFTAIFERHFSAVHRYAERRAGRDVAEEIASEAFLVAFDNRHRYRFDGDRPNALPWLLGIATNLLRRHWRAERRQLAAYARAIDRAVDDRGGHGEGAQTVPRGGMPRRPEDGRHRPPCGRDGMEDMNVADSVGAILAEESTVVAGNDLGWPAGTLVGRTTYVVRSVVASNEAVPSERE
jgi:hypothetical protein